MASVESELQAVREDCGLGIRDYEPLWQDLWHLDRRIGKTRMLARMFKRAYYRIGVRRWILVALHRSDYAMVELLSYLDGDWGVELPSLRKFRHHLANDWEAWMDSLEHPLP